MSITVGELMAIPRLHLTLLGGGAGRERQITWAHPSDLDHPWDWLTGGELVLRNGETLPADREDQLTYLGKLAETGATGLVIGDDPRTPQLSPELLAAADRLGFPLLWVPYGVGFATLARAVADANSREDPARLVRTERIYQVVRDSLAGRTRRGLLSLLERELRCRLLLVSPEGEPVPRDGGHQPTERVAAAVRTAVRETGGMIPGVLRIDAADGAGAGSSGVLVEVPAAEPTLLVLLGALPRWVDAALLQHVATAAAVEVAAWSMRLGHERRGGGELLSQLLDEQLPAGPADARFAATGLVPVECVLLAVRDALPEGERDLHLGFSWRGVPNLLLRRGEVCYAVLPDQPAALDLLRERVGERACIGVSVVLGSTRRLPAARREAEWALSVAQSVPGRLARYGDQVSLALLRDLDEARVVVDRTLGALLEYDLEHGAELVGSLSMFLSKRRSWQQTARALGVHRQTVFYRMRRVEQLTGRSLAETGDLAELWVALQARALLGGQLGEPGSPGRPEL